MPAHRGARVRLREQVARLGDGRRGRLTLAYGGFVRRHLEPQPDPIVRRRSRRPARPARCVVARDADDDVADAGGIDAIAHEIAEHLTQAGGIAFDEFGDAGGDDRANLRVLLRGAPGERFDDVLDERARAEVDGMKRRLDVERRELEQILDDREQMLGGVSMARA